MRYAEGLVQVQVGHIAAIVTWAAQSHLRIHVGPVHIDLPALGMDHLADLPTRWQHQSASSTHTQHGAGEAYRMVSSKMPLVEG